MRTLNIADMGIAMATSKIFYPCAMLTEMEEEGKIPDGSAAAYSFFYHVSRVATMCHQFAVYYELGEESEELYYKAGLLHDWGKVGDEELIGLWATQKRLRGEKRQKVRHGHVEKRALKNGLARAGIEYGSLPKEVCLTALYHHVRLVGGFDSYPVIKNPEKLPKIVRIIGIIDSFEAIISTLRPYNKKVKKIDKCKKQIRPITWTQAIRKLSVDVEQGKFNQKLFWEVSEALTSNVPLNIIHLPNLLGHYV